MAKKAVAGFRDKTSTTGRSHTKVIKINPLKICKNFPARTCGEVFY